MDKNGAEVLYDLMWNMAREEERVLEGFSDSRERFHLLLAWTKEFQRIHKNTNWDLEDYLNTVDEFFDRKMDEFR